MCEQLNLHLSQLFKLTIVMKITLIFYSQNYFADILDYKHVYNVLFNALLVKNQFYRDHYRVRVTQVDFYCEVTHFDWEICNSMIFLLSVENKHVLQM